MKKKYLMVVIAVVLLATGLSGCLQEDSTDTDQDTGQIWEIVDQSGKTATLTVDSFGYFSGSGWVGGGSSGIQPYDIGITNGRMSGNSMTFDATASYDAGAGSISATGTGTLNANFPTATSASGTWSGTISDTLGDRTFNSTWQSTRLSGGGQQTPPEDFDFDVDVEPHIVTIKQGEIATITVTVKLVKGTSQPVILTTTDWSSFDVTATLATSTVTPPATTKLYIETTCDTFPAEYLYTVQGETSGTFKTSIDSVNIIVEEDSDCDSVQFTALTQLPDATVGESYSYSFCKPDRTDENDLCGSSVNPCYNPSGGNEPYYFQLDSGSGFPPFGLTLYPNGLLMGTPTAAGERTFTVCAVDQGGHQKCVETSLNVVEQAITVSPDYLIVQPSSYCSDPCEVSSTVVVTSSVSWYIDYVTGSGTARCFDPVNPFTRYWSVCPNSGGPGDTIVTLSTGMYGESTPSYYEEKILDRGSTIRFQAVDDYSQYADLRVGLELPYYS